MKIYELVDHNNDRYEDFSHTIGFYLNQNTAKRIKEKCEKCAKCPYSYFNKDEIDVPIETINQYCCDANIGFSKYNGCCHNYIGSYGEVIIREIEVDEN